MKALAVAVACAAAATFGLFCGGIIATSRLHMAH